MVKRVRRVVLIIIIVLPSFMFGEGRSKEVFIFVVGSYNDTFHYYKPDRAFLVSVDERGQLNSSVVIPLLYREERCRVTLRSWSYITWRCQDEGPVLAARASFAEGGEVVILLWPQQMSLETERMVMKKALRMVASGEEFYRSEEAMGADELEVPRSAFVPDIPQD
jgi:hypothetical protein